MGALLLLFQRLMSAVRRAWNTKLIKRIDVPGRSFTMSFRIWENGDGERTIYLSGYQGGDNTSYPFPPQDFDRFVEAAVAIQTELQKASTSP